MKVGMMVRIGMWLLAVSAVGVFAACGDDDPADCPIVGGECQYDGDNLVSCDSDDLCDQEAGYSCLLDDGEPAMDGAEGNCGMNAASMAAVDVTLPAINWELAHFSLSQSS